MLCLQGFLGGGGKTIKVKNFRDLYFLQGCREPFVGKTFLYFPSEAVAYTLENKAHGSKAYGLANSCKCRARISQQIINKDMDA